MSELLDLPTELLLKVVSGLPRSQDVAAVAFTCKQLNRVASGELYERIRLHIAARTYRNDSAKLGVIVNLASSLFLGDPVLRNSTKTISITLPDLSALSLPRLVSHEVTAKLTKGNLREWGVTSLEQRTELVDGQVWAYVTLLLHACRQNIRTLTLDGNFVEELGFWATDLTAFDKLETVELITTDTPRVLRPPPSAAILAGLSDIPNLRTLRLTLEGAWTSIPDSPIPRPRRGFHLITNIAVLVLWKCEVKMLTIRTLLGHMPRLVTLEIDLLFAIDPDSHDFSLKWCLVDLRRLRKAILGTGLSGSLGKYRREGEHCSNTLENLKISVDFTVNRSSALAERRFREEEILPEQEDDSDGWNDSDSDESSDVSSEKEEEDDGQDKNENEDEQDEEGDEDYETTSYGAVYASEFVSGPNYHRCTRWEINKLGSLKRLKNLKKLEIEPMLLFGSLRATADDDDSDMKSGRIPRWTPLDALLPDTLEEFHIVCGPVGWSLLWEKRWKIVRQRGAGVDLGTLLEMFKAYKERGGNMPNLRKVVHTARERAGPPDGSSWDEQQMQLKHMLEDLAIGYEWSC